MKPHNVALLLVLGLLAFLPAWRLPAQDNVTIPKSRLEELERKEKELERLKGNPGKTNDANAQLKKENEKAAARPPVAPTAAPITTNVAPPAPARSDTELERLKSELTKTKDENSRLKQENEKAAARLQVAPAAQVATHMSPPMASLAPLKPEDVVEAMDLANYYHADAAAADQRYRKKKFTVHGDIIGFENPQLLTSNYRILLKTPDRTKKVICNLPAPEKANAVFT